nr:glycosyl transferase [Sphingomonadales bacterium]
MERTLIRPRILYAIQGTGNGHLSRASAFLPHLLERGELDILVSGRDVNVTLNYPVKYRLNGAGFVFGRQGSFDWWQTLAIQRPWQLLRDSGRIPLHDYDLVINDFEPVTALAASRQGYRRIVGLSHQASFLSPKTPRPALVKAPHAEWLFRHYAPCPVSIGLHFEAYDDFIHTPVIRPGIRALQATRDRNEILVYLPAYGDDLLQEFLNRYGP